MSDAGDLDRRESFAEIRKLNAEFPTAAERILLLLGTKGLGWI